MSGSDKWRMLALLAMAAASWGCGATGARGKRLIVLGIDGMDPAFLERHWDALPSLDRLRRQGEFRRLATTIPPQSPVAWSTLITGLDPGGHGIYDFVHRNPQTTLPFSSIAETEEPARTLSIGPYVLPLARGRVRSLRRGRPFWQILAERGVPVTILRMPTDFPPAEFDGRSLAGMGTPDLHGTFGVFTYYTDDVGETTRTVSGGKIVRLEAAGDAVTLAVEGPVNTLRRDRSRVSLSLEVERDPVEPVARFRLGGAVFILRQGEWSGWIRAEFPLIGRLRTVAGMFRVYARQLRPGFRLYVSPINIDPADPALPISQPESYSRELAAALGPFYTQGIAEDTAALRQGVLSREEYLAQSRLVAEEHLALLRHELDRLTSGMLFFHFLGVDQDSHMLWGRHEDELLASYRRVDAALGQVLERAEDATVIVMSDHGFAPFDRAVHLNTWLWREGFLALRPGAFRSEELFASVDWPRTQAYALGLNALYINLAGRERNGIVTPGAEAERVVARIAGRLRDARDPAGGQPMVETVYEPRKVFRGPALDSAPDLIVGYRPGYRASWQTALGAVPEAAVEDNREAWIGDHCIAAQYVPGVLLGNRRSRIEDPQLADLTVTILNEFGVAAAEGMRGRRLF